MSRRRKRKSIIDELFGDSGFGEMESLFDSFPETGYSVNVTQTPEGTKVRARVGKNTDVTTLKRELQQQYPNVEIEIEGGKKEPLIREISTKSLTEDEEKTKRD